MMEQYRTKILDMLRKILEEDKAYESEVFKQHGAATFCCQCKQNTFVGLYPDFHTLQRHLCSECGAQYRKLLEVHGLLN